MKHLRLFKTSVEFESATIIKPNVSLIKENNVLSYKPKEIEKIEYHFQTIAYVSPHIGGPEGQVLLECDASGDFSEVRNKLLSLITEKGKCKILMIDAENFCI